MRGYAVCTGPSCRDRRKGTRAIDRTRCGAVAIYQNAAETDVTFDNEANAPESAVAPVCGFD
jgi:hypothetical protein